MISTEKAAVVVNYLIDAGALNVGSDGQGVVWADIINDPVHGVPDLQDYDALAAAREAGRKWASEGRSWKVDAYRYVAAVRSLWRQRRDRYRQLNAGKPGHALNGDPQPEGNLSGEEYARWLTTAGAAIREGADAEEVLDRAWLSIGRETPTIEPTIKRDITPWVEEAHTQNRRTA